MHWTTASQCAALIFQEAPVSHHFDGAFDQQGIHQHAIVASRVPCTEFGNQHDGTLANQSLDGCALPNKAPQITVWQMGFDEHGFAPLQLFTGRYQRADACQAVCGQCALSTAYIGQGMAPPQGQGLKPDCFVTPPSPFATGPTPTKIATAARAEVTRATAAA
jgi:hypothetical protein